MKTCTQLQFLWKCSDSPTGHFWSYESYSQPCSAFCVWCLHNLARSLMWIVGIMLLPSPKSRIPSWSPSHAVWTHKLVGLDGKENVHNHVLCWMGAKLAHPVSSLFKESLLFFPFLLISQLYCPCLDPAASAECSLSPHLFFLSIATSLSVLFSSPSQAVLADGCLNYLVLLEVSAC